MDFMVFYAIAVGVILAMLFSIRIAPSLLKLKNALSFIISKYLTYPNLWDRHKLVAPWTRAESLVYLVYAVTNVLFVAFKAPSAMIAGHRAGTLTLINMGFLFLTPHLSLLADALGVTLVVCQRTHRSVGWMTGILLAFHVTMATLARQQGWSLGEQRNVFAFIVCPPPVSQKYIANSS